MIRVYLVILAFMSSVLATQLATEVPASAAVCSVDLTIRNAYYGNIAGSARTHNCSFKAGDCVGTQRRTGYNSWYSPAACRPQWGVNGVWLDGWPIGCTNNTQYNGTYRAFTIVNGKFYSSPNYTCSGSDSHFTPPSWGVVTRT